MIKHAVNSRRQWQILVTFVALGLLARTVRYIAQFPLWEDEAFLFMNLADRSYADLLRPLREFHQIAPVLFLWIEKAITDTLGSNELSLRLFPYFCSVSSLVLFWRLGHRILNGWSAVFAVAMLAVSYPAIRYAAEMKQYGVDIFAAVLLLWMWERWWSGRRHWMWIIAAATPFLVLLSFPTIFIAGGVSLASLAVLLRESDRTTAHSLPLRSWFPWIVFNATLMVAFVFLLFILGKQFEVQGGWMAVYWQNDSAFPPWQEPWRLPMWLLDTHAGKFFAFPVGSGNFASSLTLILCIVGGISFYRRERRGTLFLLLLGPVLLHLIAAGMHRYPYGAHFKFAMAHAPAICLLAGSGVAAIVRAFDNKNRIRRRVVGFWLLFFLIIGVGSMMRDVIRPYKTLSDQRARGWAQWFWRDAPHHAVVAGMKQDLNLSFSDVTFKELSWSATYLANQRIYSRRHGRNIPPDWSKVSTNRPLWIVEYRDTHKPYDKAVYERWLAHISTKFKIGSRVIYPMSRYKKNERDLIKVDEIHVLPLIPIHDSFKKEDLLLPDPNDVTAE